jgi:hypothetical protein
VIVFRRVPSGEQPPTCTHPGCRERSRGPLPALYLIEGDEHPAVPRCVNHAAAAAAARGLPFPPATTVT